MKVFASLPGRHRLEAARKVEWKRIAAIVMHDDKLDRQIRNNAENLDRSDLTVLERAEAVAQRAKDKAKKAAQDAHPKAQTLRSQHPGNCVKLFDINVGAVVGQKFYF